MEKIGFIGLGLMGGHMAANLLNAGAELTVYNRTAVKADDLVARGAARASDPAGVARAVGAGTIVISVADTPALRQVMTGEQGVLQDLAAGALVIDMGTSEVPATRELAAVVAARGASYVDAPVSGGEIGARDGTLTIMAGGRLEDVTRAQAVFDVLGEATTHIGDVGAGQIAKTANQMIVGGTVALVAEALYLAERGGVDPSRVRSALLGGFAGSRILEVHGQRMIDRAFTPGAKATTQFKDMRQAVALAKTMGLSLPLTALCRDLWTRMVDGGMDGLDQSGFFAFVDSLNKDGSLL